MANMFDNKSSDRGSIMPPWLNSNHKIMICGITVSDCIVILKMASWQRQEVAPEDRKWPHFGQASDWLKRWKTDNQKPLEDCG